MPLLGQAALIIWNGIQDRTRRDFFTWHNREHILERVSIPGFRRGRRYIAIDGEPEFFNLYEVDRFETLIQGRYPERLANPTPWTERVMPGFLAMNRALSRVVLSKGLGSGGVIATVRFNPGNAEALPRGAFTQLAEIALARHPEILGLHVCVADMIASSIDTAERRARGSATLVPPAAILVEATDPAVLTTFCSESLSAASFRTLGIDTETLTGIYRLEFSLSSGDISST
jgi:hypothetical protein